MHSSDSIKENVKNYYGEVLEGTHSLKTDACCPVDSIPNRHKEIIAQIDDEIISKFYGCGSPIPHDINGLTVLDLGCGTGRDVYLCSKLVGESGFVYGVDMTDNQLDVANAHVHSQAKRFGLQKPNVEFRKGEIEDLALIGFEDQSIDLVISNCVINLSPDKHKVFSEIFRVLKPGGELYFSDVFSNCRIPIHLRSDQLLYGECLSGAMYIEDFRRTLMSLGCQDYRVMSKKLLELDPEIQEKVGLIEFYSMSVRAFKLTSLEDICEDYGQLGVYNGTIPESPHYFDLDDHHRFISHKPLPICGNTAAMLEETRFNRYFSIIGDRQVHYGAFDCSPAEKFNNGENSATCC